MVPEFDRFMDLQRKISEAIDHEQGVTDDSFFDGLFGDEEPEAPVAQKNKRGRPKGSPNKVVTESVQTKKLSNHSGVISRLNEAIERLRRL